jgi:hypothetical protein
MSVYGNVRTMSLPDLLQWASVNKKTGVLELERNQICKRISFREGRIVACSSDDPPSRLGQFLLSRGKITKEQLREALSRQETSSRNLGLIFQDMGILTQEEIEAHVAAKAEENIYGLFDWADAEFRFHENAAQDPFIIEVDLGVQDVVLHGIQRFDELQRIRDVLTSSGIVLKRTDKPMPNEIVSSPMARRVMASVDGRRTLAEILLHAHASEFLVLKFLYTLLRKGIVSIIEVRDADPLSRTLLDLAEAEATEPPALPSTQVDPATLTDQQGPAEGRRDVETALQCMARGDYQRALDILNELHRAEPDDLRLRQLVLKAESGFLESARAEAFGPQKIPVPLPEASKPAAADLKPTDQFLLSMLDGKADIKSIVWLAPLREVDVLQALRRMLDANVIELRDPDGGPSTPEVDEEQPRNVQWSPV